MWYHILNVNPVESPGVSEQNEVRLDFPFMGFSKVADVWGARDSDWDVALLRLSSDPPDYAGPAPLFRVNRHSKNAVTLYGFPDRHDTGVPASACVEGSLPGDKVLITRESGSGFTI